MAKGKGRRGHGEGSVYQQANGYWVAAVEAGRCKGGHLRRDGTPCPGGERRRARIVRRTKAAVLAQLKELKERGDAGVAGENPTIDQYAHWWLDNVKAGNIAESSMTQYRMRVDRWIVPYLGKTRLRKLTVEDIQHWQRDLTAAGVGPTSRSDSRIALSMMLKYAVGARRIPFNPAEHVSVPAPKHKTDDTMELDEAELVLAAARGDRLEALYVLGMKYGLREGELLALTWAKVDLDGMEIKVAKAKSDAGVRDLPLLAGTHEALKERRRLHAAERLEAGPLWQDHDLVFCYPDGSPIGARQLRTMWGKLLDKAGVSRRRFHASRHTAATLLLEAGVELEVVSAILGHANINITASIYAKVRADLKRRGLAKVDERGG